MLTLKMSPEVAEWFRKNGAQGGKARALKYSKEELSAMGKKGGRPRKDQGLNKKERVK